MAPQSPNHVVGLDVEPIGQINVPPKSRTSLWKVITPALRCPICGSTETKADTGKRVNGQGLKEQYRRCVTCHIRFRLILE